MPRFLPALGSAAVIVVVAALALSFYVNRQGGIGALPSGSPSASPTAEPEATATPSPSLLAQASAEPSVEPSPAADLPVGPHVMDVTNALNEATVTLTIPATGWFAGPGGNAVTKDLGGEDRVTVVAAPADFYQVPADICNWRSDDAPSFPNSIDDFVAALAAQTYDTPKGSLARELSTPVDITIDGSPGLSITSVVPLDPNSDPDGCDEQRFCSVLDRDGYGCHLSHLEPGALDTVWVAHPADYYYLVVAATYWPTTSSELLAEMNAIVESMNPEFPASEVEPSVEPSPAADLPVGPHVMVSTVGGNSCLAGQSVGVPCEDRVTVTIPALGWFAEPDEASVTKDLGGDDHVTVVTVPGDHYHVPENICKWQAASDLVYPGEIVGGLRAYELIFYLGQQTYDTPDGSLTRDLSDRVEITTDGHIGETFWVTGAVPDIDPSGCDEQRFCSLLDQDGVECLLPHLEPNALVKFWISDHPHRNLWVVAATYWPTTSSELLAEMNAIVDSMD